MKNLKIREQMLECSNKSQNNTRFMHQDISTCCFFYQAYESYIFKYVLGAICNKTRFLFNPSNFLIDYKKESCFTNLLHQEMFCLYHRPFFINFTLVVSGLPLVPHLELHRSLLTVKSLCYSFNKIHFTNFEVFLSPSCLISFC